MLGQGKVPKDRRAPSAGPAGNVAGRAAVGAASRLRRPQDHICPRPSPALGNSCLSAAPSPGLGSQGRAEENEACHCTDPPQSPIQRKRLEMSSKNSEMRRCPESSEQACSPLLTEVHGVAASRTRLSGFDFSFHFHALEKEMATHSSVLACRIPGMGEPGGLPSMGLHRVGHD